MWRLHRFFVRDMPNAEAVRGRACRADTVLAVSEGTACSAFGAAAVPHAVSRVGRSAQLVARINGAAVSVGQDHDGVHCTTRHTLEARRVTSYQDTVDAGHDAAAAAQRGPRSCATADFTAKSCSLSSSSRASVVAVQQGTVIPTLHHGHRRGVEEQGGSRRFVSSLCPAGKLLHFELHYRTTSIPIRQVSYKMFVLILDSKNDCKHFAFLVPFLVPRFFFRASSRSHLAVKCRS
jgi:hypothetical protein